MKRFLMASLVACILFFSCTTNTEEPTATTGSSWEKQSAMPSENQDNIVSGGKAIAASIFVVVLSVFLLTMRTSRPVSIDWMYQS